MDELEILASIQKKLDHMMIDREHDLEWRFEGLRNAVAVIVSVMSHRLQKAKSD